MGGVSIWVESDSDAARVTHDCEQPASSTTRIRCAPNDRAPTAEFDGLLRQIHASIARSERSASRARALLGRTRPGTPMTRDRGLEPFMEMRFDLETAAQVLERLAELADDQAKRSLAIPAGAPILTACVGLVRDVKRWLALHRTPFDGFAGDRILEAYDGSRSIGADELATILRTTAQEIAQVKSLLDRVPSSSKPERS